MAVTSFGTPVMTRATSGSVTAAWGTGQNRTAGHLLVAAVSAGGSTASAAAISTPAGWTQQVVTSNVATTANAWVAVYTKVATGGDSAPAFTATLTGTVAMTVTLLELAAANDLSPVDTSGTYGSGGSSGTLSAMTVTTAANVSVAGEYAVTIYCQEAAAATNTWNGGGGWTNAANDGATSSVLHTAVDYLANPSSGSTATETGHWTTDTSAFGTAIIVAFGVQSGGLEVFTNNAATTITGGGGTAPAAGTAELWTAASWSSFATASPTTTPPTTFHIADPGASSELIQVVNTSTGLVVRGAEGTTPVSHSGGFTVRNVISAGAGAQFRQQVYNVRAEPFNAAGNGSTDDTAAIQAAWAACLSAGGGTVYIPEGTYKTSSTIGGNVNGVPVAIYGAPGSKISYYGSGDCIRMYDSSAYGSRTYRMGPGVFGFLTLDGTNSSASAASTALHAGDIFQLGVYCTVSNWNAFAGSMGVHFDNNYYWTEQLYGRIFAESCLAHVVFDNSTSGTTTSTGSFDRFDLDIYIDQNNATYDGVVFQNGTYSQDFALSIRGNFATQVAAVSSAVLRITGSAGAGRTDTGDFSSLLYGQLDTGVECDTGAGANAPFTIFFGSTSNTIFDCYGGMDFYAATTAFQGSNAVPNQIIYAGFINGDANIASTYVMNLIQTSDIELFGGTGLTATLEADNYGNLEYVNQDDGSTYNTGRLTLYAATTQAVATTAVTNAITSMSAPVGSAATYRVSGLIPYSSGTSAGTPIFAFTGPTTSLCAFTSLYQNSTTTLIAPINQTTLTTPMTGPTLTNSTAHVLHINGIFTFSAAGTFQLNGYCSVAADAYTVLTGAYLDIMPVG